MAKQYVVTDEEMQSLIESLELNKLRKFDDARGTAEENKQRAQIDDLHRSFHYVVVRWTQAMGYKGLR